MTKKRSYLILLLLLALPAPFVAWAYAAQSPPRPKLWAAVSVSQPLFYKGDASRLMVYFAIVNDGAEVAYPKIIESEIVVNGVALANSQFILGNGLEKKEKFLPGESTSFTYGLGKYFAEPGIYKVAWRGEGFESAAVEFRVVANGP